MPHFDFIIVGGGLAGSVLALSFLENEKSVLLIDQPILSSSSKVAAGLFQPMTFKRTIETWKGYDSIQTSIDFYKKAEKKLNSDFFHELKMSRIFSSYEEQNNWALKSDDDFYKKLISEEKNAEAELCQPPYGYGGVNYAGYLDVNSFLLAAQNFLKSTNSILEEKFDYQKLVIEENRISYKEYSASHIIFSEGWLIKDNPWFNYLPMKPVKGEVLTLEIPDRNNQSIISSGVFAVPIDEKTYKVGSNYDWKTLNESPTSEVKDELIHKLKEMLQVGEVKITQHVAGVRPASHDRRPYIGNHPQYSSLIVFNGLGARGVSLAPYCASFLMNYLIDKTEIPQEINVKRCHKYFHR